ncbi:MAG: ABC transporter substrate-binding protein [Thermodesulfobacteriota bacterium]
MKTIFRHLWPAVSLILAASFILLLSDREQRTGHVKEIARVFPSIAVMQIASSAVLDTHVAGVVSRLDEKGYRAPDGKNIRFYNPQGDYATASAMARDMVNSPYGLLITSSTVALQVVAKANTAVRKPHVFGTVTDPYGAGVGITGPEPDQHPPYMAGVGTFQPVERTIEIARDMNPGLKRLGVVWNPGEQCSEVCLKKARQTCESLGIELVEANAGNTSEVPEALRSVIAKNVNAVWVGGDNVAIAAVRLMIDLAGQAGIPVFTNDPTDTEKGALFGLGADYFTVGQYTADIAVAVLEGKKPSAFRIENMVPEKLAVNRQVLASLKDMWRMTSPIEQLLSGQKPQPGEEPADPDPDSPVQDLAELTARTAPGSSSPADTPLSPEKSRQLALDMAALEKAGVTPPEDLLTKADVFLNLRGPDQPPAKIALVNLVENTALLDAVNGVKTALYEMGLREKTDFTVTEYCAQGDMSQLSQILDRIAMEPPDALVTVTTPAFIAAVKRDFAFPLIFTVCSDPEKLGVFKTGRPPNVCGIYDDPPVAELLRMAAKHDPALKAVGIIYDAGQMNSLISVEKLRRAGPDQGITVLEATASTVSDLPMAARSVIQRGAGAIILSADNLVTTGFAAIDKAAGEAGIPIYVTDVDLVAKGADGAIGDSYFEWGKASGELVARVLAGVPPARLPVSPTRVHHRVDPGEITAAPPAKPFQLRIVLYSETEFAEQCRQGLIDGIAKAGLREGRDYVLKSYNAQGDMSTLSSIMTTVRSDRVDLLMAVSTPTLQAALRQAGEETRIVFTGVGDGVKAGAGKSETDHLPNVTGITTRSPFEGMVRIIRQTLPDARRVGTLFTPAEINSVLYKDGLKEALEKEGLELVTVPVTSSADVAQAAIELCGQDIQVVAQVVDNLTRPGFALIARKAAENDLPVFVFDSAQMKDGGVICLARDYYDAGLEAAEKAVRILRGENPGTIPFTNTQSEKLLVNRDLAARYKLRISDELMKKATLFKPDNERDGK